MRRGKDLKQKTLNSQVENIFSVLTKKKLPTANVLPVLRHPFDPMVDDIISETDSRIDMLFMGSESDHSDSS